MGEVYCARDTKLTRDVAIKVLPDLYVPFYGGRQFSIQDDNGLTLIFWQPEWLSPSDGSQV